MAITEYHYNRGHYVEKLIRAKIRGKSRYWSIHKYGYEQAKKLAVEWYTKTLERINKSSNPLKTQLKAHTPLGGMYVTYDTRTNSYVLVISYRENNSYRSTTCSLNRHSFESAADKYIKIRTEKGHHTPPIDEVVHAIKLSLQKRKQHRGDE